MTTRELRALDRYVHSLIGQISKRVPRYSTNIASAFRALEFLLDDVGGCFTTCPEGWACAFSPYEDFESEKTAGKSAALVICKAIKAKWYTPPKKNPDAMVCDIDFSQAKELTIVGRRFSRPVKAMREEAK